MDTIYTSANLLVHFDDDAGDNNDTLVQLPMWHGEAARPLYSVSLKDLSLIRDASPSNDWLVLSVYSTVNIVYVCQRDEFDQKVAEHFQDSQAYVRIEERFTMCDQSVRHTLRSLVKLVQTELCCLLRQHALTRMQYRQLMRYHVDDNYLSSLTFVPDTHQVTIHCSCCSPFFDTFNSCIV